VQSAHDCSDGGLYITLLESSMPNNLGFDIFCESEIRKDAFLFGEAQGRVVVSVSNEDEDAFIEYLAEAPIEFSHLGDVTGGDIYIDEELFTTVKESKALYDEAIEKLMK
jgi:phosphoribosylformylglycinamidine synthase subunit PurL